MKKLFYLLIAVVLIACKTDEPQAFVIKDTDMISIRPAASAANAPQKVKADEAHLSALEIVKQTSAIQYKYSGIKVERSFNKTQRDTVSTTPKLLMWATDVITLDGQLQPEFIEATDVLFVTYESIFSSTPKDTIAYIPNATLRAAETAIRAAYEDKDIEACYTAFNTAYTFTPITGAEWRALKLAGNNYKKGS